MQNFQFSGDPVPPLRAITANGRTVPPSREEIRAFAVAKIEEIARTSVERGANYQHLLLDLQGQATAFAQTFEEQDRGSFFSVMQEELEAALSALNQRGEKFEAQAIGRAAGPNRVVMTVGAVTVFVLLYVLFRLFF